VEPQSGYSITVVAVSTSPAHDGSVALIAVSSAFLLLSLAVLYRPQLEWKLLRGRLANPEIDDPTRAWRATIRAFAFLVAVVATIFLIFGISRL
jgi:hypothetical protein